MARDDVKGITKAATLLLYLGVEASIEVTKCLTRASAYDIVRQASKLNTHDPEVTLAVLTEFHELLEQCAENPSGKEFAASVMEQAFGDDDPLSNIDFLKRLDRGQLLEIAQNEHPQVVAFVLSYISPDQSSVLLAELTPERQLEVAERIATSEPPQRDVLRHLARSLGARLNNFTGSDGAGLEVGGLGTLAKIMKGVGREVEQNILAGFSETRPDLAEELKKNMFVFDDLVVLDDRSIQRLLKEVDGKVLALSLKRASAELVDLIKRNMSERGRNILQEDLNEAGKVRLKEVDKAQSEIVNVVRRLTDSGEIVVSREDEAYV